MSACAKVKMKIQARKMFGSGRAIVTLMPALLLLFGLTAVGCGGSNDGRVPLAGEVYFAGQPLDRGSIEFHPQGGEGTLTGGTVQDGKFDIPAVQGAKPGKYQVRVFAAGDGTEVDPNEPPGPEAGRQVATERIPARFNVSSELEVEVVPKGNQELRFDLEAS
jgi:hypothetical protein